MAWLAMLNPSRASTPLDTLADHHSRERSSPQQPGRAQRAASGFPHHLLQPRPQSHFIGHEIASNPPRLKPSQKLTDARARREAGGQDIAPAEREARWLPALGEAVAMLPGWIFGRSTGARPGQQHPRAVSGRAA